MSGSSLTSATASSQGMGAAAVSATVFAPAGFFMTGTDAHIPAGTQVIARLDEDVPVMFAGGAGPTPMAVAAAAPAAVQAAALQK